MKILFWLGLAVLILGGASLFVPIPRNQQEGFSAGGVSIGIATRHSETVTPLVSVAMILAGAGMMIAGSSRKAA